MRWDDSDSNGGLFAYKTGYLWLILLENTLLDTFFYPQMKIVHEVESCNSLVPLLFTLM